MADTTVVICRSATHFLRLGYVKGYRCQVCGAELQVSPAGIEQIAAGGMPVCNPCGFSMADTALGVDASRVELRENPGARQQREEMKARRRRNV